MTTVYIISAPSGSGKSTLVDELRRQVKGLKFSVSYTTRAPRGSEQDGREYYFVPRAEFEEMIRKDEFLEHAEVFGENYYGTARRFLREAQAEGSDLLLDIDVQGAEQIKRKIPDAATIFVLVDRKTLEWRLFNRGSDSAQQRRRRLDTARREIENYDKYDYILVNDRLEDSVDRLKAIVLSERLRRSGCPISPEDQTKFAVAEQCRLKNMRDRVQSILDSFRDGDSQP